jgi:hypothetical protein
MHKTSNKIDVNLMVVQIYPQGSFSLPATFQIYCRNTFDESVTFSVKLV